MHHNIFGRVHTRRHASSTQYSGSYSESLTLDAAFTWSELQQLKAWGQGLRAAQVDITNIGECSLEFAEKTTFPRDDWGKAFGDLTMEHVVPHLSGLITPAARRVNDTAAPYITETWRRLDAVAEREETRRQATAPYKAWMREKEMLEQRYGPLPPVIGRRRALRYEVNGVVGERWQTVVMEAIDEAIGGTISVDRLNTELYRHFGWRSSEYPRADKLRLMTFLHDLRADGWVDFTSFNTFWVEGDIRVFGSLQRPPAE